MTSWVITTQKSANDVLQFSAAESVSGKIISIYTMTRTLVVLTSSMYCRVQGRESELVNRHGCKLSVIFPSLIVLSIGAMVDPRECDNSFRGIRKSWVLATGGRWQLFAGFLHFLAGLFQKFTRSITETRTRCSQNQQVQYHHHDSVERKWQSRPTADGIQAKTEWTHHKTRPEHCDVV